jgi:hypothetical protein
MIIPALVLETLSVGVPPPHAARATGAATAIAVIPVAASRVLVRLILPP